MILIYNHLVYWSNHKYILNTKEVIKNLLTFFETVSASSIVVYSIPVKKKPSNGFFHIKTIQYNAEDIIRKTKNSSDAIEKGMEDSIVSS